MESSFAPILVVADLMRSFRAPWFVSGGWAIDLFLGNISRPHHDIEIGIYRRDQHAIHNHLPGWSLGQCIQTPEGGKWIPWSPAEMLRLPIHQIRAVPPSAAGTEFEFFLNERDGEKWTSRRHAGLAVPMNKATLHSFLNIPILAPEIQLLFKSMYVNARRRPQNRD